MTTKTIPEQEFLQRLDAFIKANFGSASKAADHYGISRQYMSVVMKGRSVPSQRILEDMGYARRKVVVYDLIEQN